MSGMEKVLHAAQCRVKIDEMMLPISIEDSRIVQIGPHTRKVR